MKSVWPAMIGRAEKHETPTELEYHHYDEYAVIEAPGPHSDWTLTLGDSDNIFEKDREAQYTFETQAAVLSALRDFFSSSPVWQWL